jgi:Fic family protein
MTLKNFSRKPETIPAITSWYLADLGEARGKQELFTRQAPQKLKVLREHALIESAVSSNRIEGVEVEQKRIHTLIFGKPVLKDRDEEEVRGYRDALNFIHGPGVKIPISEETILKFHQMIRGEIWDAGKYKEKNGDIIEKYADGRQRVRFKTVKAEKTPEAIRKLLEMWNECLSEKWVHPLIALTAFNLDFLCIHPFRDGNGRVSRLLLLLQCYHLGYEVGRYISMERLIEQNKERYYETLEQSSQSWHEGKHDPWPYINYLLFILKTAYREFEERVGQMASPKGSKTEIVLETLRKQIGEFRLTDIERACPGVGREWIRVILAKLKKSGEIACKGKGPAARWLFRDRKGSITK